MERKALYRPRGRRCPTCARNRKGSRTAVAEGARKTRGRRESQGGSWGQMRTVLVGDEKSLEGF